MMAEESVVVRVGFRDETKEIRAKLLSYVQDVEVMAARVFECGSVGTWGLYQSEMSAGKEGWLDSRRTLEWYMPITGTLEWREKGRVAELLFLNGRRTRVRIDDSQTVGHIMQTVGATLGIPTTSLPEYGVKLSGKKQNTGLVDKDVSASSWLDPLKTLQEQGVSASSKLELAWFKRWYARDHLLIGTDDSETLYVFLEWRQAFLADQLDTSRVSPNELCKAAAALLQMDHGKYDKKKHTATWYAGKKYVPDSCSEILTFAAICQQWKSLEDAPSVRKTFLEVCSVLPGFGCTFYEATLSESREAVVLSVDSEGVTMFAPWHGQARRGPDTSAAKRKSIVALALSPRGPSLSSDEEQSPTNAKTLSRASGKKGSVDSTSTLQPLPLEEDDPAPESDELKKSPRATKDSPSPVVSRLGVGGGSGGSGGGGPGSLKRTFTLSRKKESSSTLRKTGTLSKAASSGRFKLSILRSTKGSAEETGPLPAADSGPEISNGNVIEDAPVAVPTIQAPTGQDTSEGSQRLVLKTLAIEDLRSWSLCGNSVGIYVQGDAPVRLLFESAQRATDFCDLLHGYCSFRMEECVINVDVLENHFSLELSTVNHACPVSILLVSEMWHRLRLRWMNSKKSSALPPDGLEHLRSLCGTAAGLKEMCDLTQSFASSARDDPVLVSALEGLRVASQYAFSEVEFDEQAPCHALEAIRTHSLQVAMLFTAFSNALLLSEEEADASIVDSCVSGSGFLAALEESARHPHSADSHLKLLRIAKCISPVLAQMALLRVGGPDTGALVCIARFSRDALSELLNGMKAAENLVGTPALDDFLLQVWDLGAVLMRSTVVQDSKFQHKFGELSLAIQRLVMRGGCEPWDALTVRIETFMEALRGLVALSSVVSVIGSKNAAYNASLKRISEIVGWMVPFLSDAYHRRVYCPASKGPSLSMVTARLKICRALASLQRHLEGPATLMAARQRIEDIVFPLGKALSSTDESGVSDADVKSWSEEWKTQTADISTHIRGFKTSIRSEPSADEMPIVCEMWFRLLRELGEHLQELTRPFLQHSLFHASTNIIRTYHLVCAKVLKFADLSLAASMHKTEGAEAELRALQQKVLRDLDSLVTVINYNNPAQASARNRGVAADQIGAGGGWKRRGDISNKGAALKQVLAKGPEKGKFLTGARRKESPANSISLGQPSAATTTPTTPTTPAAGDRGARPVLSSQNFKGSRDSDSRRRSGEWKEDD